MFNKVIQKLRGADDSSCKKGKLALKDLKKITTADQYNSLVALEKEKKLSHNSGSSIVHKEANMLRDGSPDSLRLSLLAKALAGREY